MSKVTNPEHAALIATAVDGNAALVTSVIALEQAAEAFDQAFIDSAKAFAAARDGKVTVAALAKALKERAGDSSVSLRGVQWFTSNASVEAHAWTGRFYALTGSLDEVGPAEVQTLITQIYNTKGGSKAIAKALENDDQEAALKALREALKAIRDAAKAQDDEGDEGNKGQQPNEAQPTLVDVLAAVTGPLHAAVAMAEAEGVGAEARALIAALWADLAAIDAVTDHAQLDDEAADLAEIAS